MKLLVKPLVLNSSEILCEHYPNQWKRKTSILAMICYCWHGFSKWPGDSSKLAPGFLFLWGWRREDAVILDIGFCQATFTMKLFTKLQSIPAWTWTWPQIGECKYQGIKHRRWCCCAVSSATHALLPQSTLPCKLETLWGHWEKLKWLSSSLLYLHVVVCQLE